MARRYPRPVEDLDAAPGVHARLAGLVARLDAVEARTEGHDADLAALGRSLARIVDHDGTSTPNPRPATDAGNERRDWFAVTDPAEAAVWLLDLLAWLGRVGAPHQVCPAPCWPLHPDVVSELLALGDAHAAAYTGTPDAVMEWLTRWLPTTRDLVRDVLTRCSDGHRIGPTAYTVSDLDVAAVAAWWTTDRATTADRALSAYLHPIDPH